MQDRAARSPSHPRPAPKQGKQEEHPMKKSTQPIQTIKPFEKKK